MYQIMDTQFIILQSCMWCNIENKRFNFMNGWHMSPKTKNGLSVGSWPSQKSDGRWNPTYLTAWVEITVMLQVTPNIGREKNSNISKVDWIRRHFDWRLNDETFRKSMEWGYISKVGQTRRHFESRLKWGNIFFIWSPIAQTRTPSPFSWSVCWLWPSLTQLSTSNETRRRRLTKNNYK